MEFARTNAALATLSGYDADSLTLQEAVALLRAAIEDITAEAAPLKSLPVSAQAATDWMAVSRALLDADVGSEMNEMSEKKQERLTALTQTYLDKYLKYQAEIEQAQQNLSAAESENEELHRKLDALEKEKEQIKLRNAENEALHAKISELENEASSLRQSAELLKFSHEDSKKKLADCQLKKQTWERLLEEAEIKLAQAENDLKEIQRKREQAELLLSEKKSAAASLRTSIDDAKRQTEAAEQRIKELEQQKAQLSAIDTGSMRSRAAELEEYNEQLKEANTELQLQISSLTADADRREKVRTDLLEQIEQMKQEAAAAEADLRSKKAEKEDQENLIIRLTNTRKAYEQALSPQEAARRKKDISSLQKTIKMYESIVRDLFNGSGSYTMQAIKEQAQAFSYELNNQIADIQQRLNHLNQNYLHVVYSIEREVNSHDM